MNRIQTAFLKQKKCFIPFFTAGDPTLEKTIEFVLDAEHAGADIVELGIPFSDPVAEGPVIQRANMRALRQNESGASSVTLDAVFDMVVKLRKKTQIPLVFLTYMNPVFYYGTAKFMETCQKTGIDGIIIPDLPFEERRDVLADCQKNGVNLITLISPTSKDRIATLAKDSTGFVYCVSSMGVTGMRENIRTDLSGMVSAIKEYTDTPVAIGFGIKKEEQAKEFINFADGIIVGSAIVNIVEEYGENANNAVYDYIKRMKAAMA